jgi:hypothetical protein
MTVGLTTLGTVVNGQSTDSVTDRQQSGVPNRTNYAFFIASTYDDANVQTFQLGSLFNQLCYFSLYCMKIYLQILRFGSVC